MAHVLQNLAAAALGTGPPRPAMETQVSFLRRCLAGLQRNPERSGREPNIIYYVPIIVVYSLYLQRCLGYSLSRKSDAKKKLFVDQKACTSEHELDIAG